MSSDTARVAFAAVPGPDAGLLTVSGELDIASAATMRDAVATLGDINITIDLAGLHFVDARGIAELARIVRSHRARRRGVQLVHASPRIRRVFQLVHVEHLLTDD